MGGPHLLGGGFFSSAKKSLSSLATNVVGKAKEVLKNAAPILLDTAKCWEICPTCNIKR